MCSVPQAMPYGYFIDMEEFMSLCKEKKITRMMRCQELVSQFPEVIADPKLNYDNSIFFTHRWDDREHPDPNNWQIDAICTYGAEKKNIGRWPIEFWYDYSSLPQNPRTAREDVLFKEGLKQINYLCRECLNVPLISKYGSTREAAIQHMLNRGWILAELYISQYHENIHQSIYEGAGDYILDGRLNNSYWKTLLNKMTKNLPFYDKDLVREWFDVRDIKCTSGSDLDMLAERLVEYAFGYSGDLNIKMTLLPISEGQYITMTADECQPYNIDKYGLSSLYPNTFFEYDLLKHNKYRIKAKFRPTLPPIGQWLDLSEKDTADYQIKSDGTSDLYPGVVFELVSVTGGYHIRYRLIDDKKCS